MKKRVRIEVRGVVQGVFFRQSTRQRAEARGIVGWVRNQADGSVEALFEGEATAVDALVAWCERGPIGAEVSEVVKIDEPVRGEFTRFAIVG